MIAGLLGLYVGDKVGILPKQNINFKRKGFIRTVSFFGPGTVKGVQVKKAQWLQKTVHKLEMEMMRSRLEAFRGLGGAERCIH